MRITADFAHEQTNPTLCRCRFIAHTADLSAFTGIYDIPINLLITIIGPGLVFHSHLKWVLRSKVMVGLKNAVQNERYVSGIFDNEEKSYNK